MRGYFFIKIFAISSCLLLLFPGSLFLVDYEQGKAKTPVALYLGGQDRSMQIAGQVLSLKTNGPILTHPGSLATALQLDVPVLVIFAHGSPTGIVSDNTLIYWNQLAALIENSPAKRVFIGACYADRVVSRLHERDKVFAARGIADVVQTALVFSSFIDYLGGTITDKQLQVRLGEAEQRAQKVLSNPNSRIPLISDLSLHNELQAKLDKYYVFDKATYNPFTGDWSLEPWNSGRGRNGLNVVWYGFSRTEVKNIFDNCINWESRDGSDNVLDTKTGYPKQKFDRFSKNLIDFWHIRVWDLGSASTGKKILVGQVHKTKIVALIPPFKTWGWYEEGEAAMDKSCWGSYRYRDRMQFFPSGDTYDTDDNAAHDFQNGYPLIISKEAVTKTSGGGCPFVAPWNGTTFKMENNIFPLLENPTGPDRDVVDYYVFQNIIIPKNGFLNVKIFETAEDTTFLDKANLYSIYLQRDDPHQVVVDPSGHILTYINPTPPVGAIDCDGVDIREKINVINDDKYVGGYPGYFVDLDFGTISVTRNAKLILNADAVKESLMIFIQTTSTEWRLVGVLHPRVNWAMEGLELGPWNGGQLRVRILFTKGHKVDFIGLDLSPNTPTKVLKHRLISAKHSSDGDFNSLLRKSRDDYAVIEPKESLVLSFSQKRLLDSVQWELRRFILRVEGHVQTPTSDSFTDEVFEEDSSHEEDQELLNIMRQNTGGKAIQSCTVFQQRREMGLEKG